MLCYLLLLADEGDRWEFEALYQEYYKFALRLAYYSLRDHGLAEDAVHDAFCSIVQNFEKISGKSCQQKGAYLVKTVKNKCIDIVKREARYRGMAVFSEELTLPYDHVRMEEYYKEMRADYKKAAMLIAELPELYRTVMEHRLLEGMSNGETAGRLGITEDACSKRFERGRKMVAKQLNEEGIYQ